MQRNSPLSSGVTGPKLKWPKPAPWIWMTGSPSPVISYHSRAPFTSMKSPAIASLLSASRRRRKYMSDIRARSENRRQTNLGAGARESRTLDLPVMTLPLADVRIIAVEQYGAGPWGTLQLADLGADVIKIEDPRSGGDVGRYVPPFQQGEDSLFFETFNRNKRSLSLDLRHPEGRGVLEDLAR